MSSGLPGFGGQGYVKQDTRALSSIAETPGADLSQGQEEQIKMLQSHDYQIKFLASQMKQAQKGISDANKNPIQQVEQFIADIIILLGGGELATGALDFGDLQYILPALGAMFGFGDGPFPISLFEAAEKFFLGYVVPNAQFVDVINGIIQAWLGTLGIDPKFIKDIKSLVTALGDLFDGLENLLPSLDQLFNALGISAGDLGPFGQILGPIIKLFSGLDLKDFGNMIEFITSAIDPFIVSLTAIINWVDSILAVFGFSGSGGVVNSPLGDTTLPFGNLLSFLGDINFTSPDFNPIAAAVTFITNILSPTGMLASVGGVASAIQAAITQILNMFTGGGFGALLTLLLGGQATQQAQIDALSSGGFIYDPAIDGVTGWTTLTPTPLVLSPRGAFIQAPVVTVAYRDSGITQNAYGVSFVIDPTMRGVSGMAICADSAGASWVGLLAYRGFDGDALWLVSGASPTLWVIQKQVDLSGANRLSGPTTLNIKTDGVSTFLPLLNGQPVNALNWTDTGGIAIHNSTHRGVLLISNGLNRNEDAYLGPLIKGKVSTHAA